MRRNDRASGRRYPASAERIAFFTDQRNEATRHGLRRDRPSLLLNHHVQELGIDRSDRNNQMSALAKLRDKCGRDFGGRGRDDDGIEGRARRQARLKAR